MRVELDRAAAAFIAGVPASVFDRAVDRQRVSVTRGQGSRWPTRRSPRRLTSDQAFILAVDAKLAETLGDKARQELRETLARRLAEQEVADVGMTQIDIASLPTMVDLSPLARAFAERLGAWQSALELIVEDPEVQGGAPTFRGTRILVREIAAALDAGTDCGELAEDYGLTPEQMEAARVYVAARPARGRPRRGSVGAPGSA